MLMGGFIDVDVSRNNASHEAQELSLSGDEFENLRRALRLDTDLRNGFSAYAWTKLLNGGAMIFADLHDPQTVDLLYEALSDLLINNINAAIAAAVTVYANSDRTFRLPMKFPIPNQLSRIPFDGKIAGVLFFETLTTQLVDRIDPLVGS